MAKPSSTLAGYQRRYLRKLAHGRKPIIFVGDAQVSDGVVSALDQALADHELVKVKLPGAESKKQLAQELAERGSAHLCGLVGHIAILYRAKPKEPVIVLPDRED